MKKICFMVDSVFNLGGIQRVVTNLANNLNDSYDITIACVRKIPNKKRVEYGLNSNIKVVVIDNYLNKIINDKCLLFPLRVLAHINKKKHIFKNKSKLSENIEFGYQFARKKNLINFINENKFDYVLAEGIDLSILLSMIKQRLNEYTQTIGCWHASYFTYEKKYSSDLIKKSLLSHNQTIVLNEQDVEMIYNKYNIKVKCIYNPLITKSKDESKLITKKFLAVGRYSYVKGFDILIKAFKIFNDYNKEWTLDIVGDGPEKEKLNKLIIENNLEEYIKLTGKTDDVDSFYLNSSCLLVSSREEGFGMVLIEAMAKKLPVIVFDVPVFHEILPRDYKYIIEKDNINKYAEAMLEYAEDYELRKNNGELLKECSKKFNIDCIVEQWKKILK